MCGHTVRKSYVGNNNRDNFPTSNTTQILKQRYPVIKSSSGPPNDMTQAETTSTHFESTQPPCVVCYQRTSEHCDPLWHCPTRKHRIHILTCGTKSACECRQAQLDMVTNFIAYFERCGQAERDSATIEQEESLLPCCEVSVRDAHSSTGIKEDRLKKQEPNCATPPNVQQSVDMKIEEQCDPIDLRHCSVKDRKEAVVVKPNEEETTIPVLCPVGAQHTTSKPLSPVSLDSLPSDLSLQPLDLSLSGRVYI